MGRNGMTDCARRVWRFVWECFEAGAGSPSIREIAAAISYSPASVHAALHLLAAMGYIRLGYTGERKCWRNILAVTPPLDAEVESPAERAARRLIGWDDDGPA
ncbi:MAG: helix-turn-helix domain-containing protein [Chloroflexi bacterium]|nr:helix-turn-helix domain-containing protein [Chloroflexota bacterium]